VPQPEAEWTYVQLEERGWVDAMDKKRQALVDEGWLPKGVERVKDWRGVVEWVRWFGDQAAAER
jgi:hypothetical protein